MITNNLCYFCVNTLGGNTRCASGLNSKLIQCTMLEIFCCEHARQSTVFSHKSVIFNVIFDVKLLYLTHYMIVSHVCLHNSYPLQFFMKRKWRSVFDAVPSCFETNVLSHYLGRRRRSQRVMQTVSNMTIGCSGCQKTAVMLDYNISIQGTKWTQSDRMVQSYMTLHSAHNPSRLSMHALFCSPNTDGFATA